MFKNTFVTADDIAESIKKSEFTLLPDGRTTICTLTLHNGFTVRGESSCVSASNYKKDLGEKYSREDAVDNVWPFLGVLLAEKLHHEAQQKQTKTHVDRMQDELKELTSRVARLTNFIGSPGYDILPLDEQADLRIQLTQMRGYYEVLSRRVARHQRS